MTDQTSIPFTPRTPVARTEDEDTSHLAAHDVTSDGTRKRQARDVLRLVQMFPGYTAREYDKLSGYQTEVAHRRLPELADPKNGGPFVKKGEKRRCRYSRKLCCTWLPVEVE